MERSDLERGFFFGALSVMQVLRALALAYFTVTTVSFIRKKSGHNPDLYTILTFVFLCLELFFLIVAAVAGIWKRWNQED